MTGLEPHPIFTLPTREQALELETALGREEAARRMSLIISERRQKMELERSDPFQYGYESPIWHLVDDLLVDGNKVVLDLTRLARISPDGKTIPLEVDVPREIVGAPEIWLGGSNRSSKSEYGVKKIVKVLDDTPEGRTWSFADTGPISVARQQPVFWKYMPIAEKRLAAATGKMRQGPGAKITWSKAGGFAGETFVLLNLAQHWFKNYAQDIENMEGDQLDAILLDELRNVMLLKTLRGRMGDRGGIIIVSFTSIDENYSEVVNEYDRGSRTVLEVDAELLPVKNAAGELTGQFEKVPRVKVAGPGSDGDQRANIVYFHITDNPFYGFSAKPPKPGAPPPLFGKERFYKMYRTAVRTKILSRVYGILTSGSRVKFPEFNEAIHVIDPDKIPAAAGCSNYHLVDPHDGRNWAMIWPRLDSRDHWFIAREWPSTGHNEKSAYIPGIGDPGPWTLPGGARTGGKKPPEDGAQGPAQNNFGFGLSRYKQEILRVEGHAEAVPENRKAETGNRNGDSGGVGLSGDKVKRFTPRNPIFKNSRVQIGETLPVGVEKIHERYMDSRYGASPTTTNEGSTTLIEQMSEQDMEFLAASGKNIDEGLDLIHELLDYDKELPLGEWSPRLGRINDPLMKVSRNCPNVIYALLNYTGKDGAQGACKEWIDLLRYAALVPLQYVGTDSYAWGKY